MKSDLKQELLTLLGLICISLLFWFYWHTTYYSFPYSVITLGETRRSVRILYNGSWVTCERYWPTTQGFVLIDCNNGATFKEIRDMEIVK